MNCTGFLGAWVLFPIKNVWCGDILGYSKRQKTILSAFGLDEDNVKFKATEISRLLSDGMSLMDSGKKQRR